MTTGKDISIYTQVVLKMWVDLNKRFPISDNEWSDVSRLTYNLIANIEKNIGYSRDISQSTPYRNEPPMTLEEAIEDKVRKNGSVF